MFSSTLAVYSVAGLVVVLFGASLAETRLTIRINDGQETTNLDALVNPQAKVSVSCSDDAATGNLNVNGVPTTLPKESDGVWIINSMSLADQGAYQCCVQGRCEEVAVITVPPDNNVMVVAAEGERPTLSCPLEFVKRFGQYYTAEWRVPVDMTIAKSRSGAFQPWAHLNDNTLALTVGPLNSSLPRVFECVILSFNRRNTLQISNVPKGTVNVALASSQKLQVTVSPSVIASGSGRRFMISCGAANGQMLYRAQYQFFFNGRPIGTSTPSNSSYIMVSGSSSGNFTCNATQYSDLGTPIPSQLSPPVQAIVLDAPMLSRSPAGTNNNCLQEVTVTLQQPAPDGMYYAFSRTITDSCVGLGDPIEVNTTTDRSTLKFTVNVGRSGLDTRQPMYLISWYMMNGVKGPCKDVLMKQTAEACPPPQEIFTPHVIAGIVGGLVIFALLIIVVTVTVMFVAHRRYHELRGVTCIKRQSSENKNESTKDDSS